MFVKKSYIKSLEQALERVMKENTQNTVLLNKKDEAESILIKKINNLEFIIETQNIKIQENDIYFKDDIGFKYKELKIAYDKQFANYQQFYINYMKVINFIKKFRSVFGEIAETFPKELRELKDFPLQGWESKNDVG